MSAAAEVVVLLDGMERHEFPNGQRLWFNPADHSYWRCNDTGGRGRRLTGVTTVAKVLDTDPSNLIAAGACVQTLGLGRLLQLHPEWAGWLDEEFTTFTSGRPVTSWAKWRKNPEGVWAALEQLKLTYRDVWDRAAKRGTNVHVQVFETLCKGETPPALDALDFNERLAAEGVMAFWRDHQPEPILVEQVVYSERLGVAGRLDFYGRLATREGVGIVDVKTGGFLSAAAHAQVGGGYPLLVQESGWDAPEWSLMLQVKDGGYTLVEAEGTPEDFEAAVAAYRCAGRINNAALKARKAREAA